MAQHPEIAAEFRQLARMVADLRVGDPSLALIFDQLVQTLGLHIAELQVRMDDLEAKVRGRLN